MPAALARAGLDAGGVAVRIDGAIEGLLRPLDRLRAVGLRLVARAWPAPIASRELRVAVGGALAVSASLALALGAPLWLLTLGPLVLGVPHLLSDLRYLVARPGLHRRPGFMALVATPVVLTLLWPRLPLGLLSVAGAVLLARASRTARALWGLAALGLAGAALAGGFLVEVAFAHAHNLVALVLWWRLRSRRPGRQRLTLLLALGGALVLVAAGDRLVVRLGTLAPPAPGLDAGTLAATLAPLSDPGLSLRVLLLFAFAQSVHYAVWLRLVPDDARPRPGMRPLASSYRALAADCGRALPLGALALALSLGAVALADLETARTAYLRLAIFHGPLELAVVALARLERRPLRVLLGATG